LVTELLARPLTAQNDTFKNPTDAPNWRRHYAYRLVVTDALVLCWAVFGAAHLSFDPLKPLVGASPLLDFSVNYLVVSAVVVAVWVAALAAVGSRHYRVIGTGSAEFKAVLQSALVVLLLICLANFAFKLDVSRRFVLLAIPLGLLALLVSRVLWRRWLSLHRSQGLLSSRVLLVGSGETAVHIAGELGRHSDAGYHVVGVLVTDRSSGSMVGLSGVPVFGSVDDLLGAVSACRADTVFITDGHDLPPARLRELSWSLEPGRQHLVMAPSLTDIAGPRIHARPVAGLPLVHVETPRYEGVNRFLKRAFDIVVSSGLLLLLSVPLLVVALLIVTTSKGGVLFAHERIGKHGRPFRMLKFRSMVADADSRLDSLLRAQGTNDKPLFKVTNDPRITPIGGVLRRYSIDEIPQLINVLRGEMSLVGPRPLVDEEDARIEGLHRRRLDVTPGMTGAWQILGSSRVPMRDMVTIDYLYRTNWSLWLDVKILLRTVPHVLRRRGM
jgi:exopolysaccharide biosynthesis polyprenyl glycosylphosphotransferase